MKRLDTYKLLNIASVVVIVLVVFIISMSLYIRFAPVDVIKNSTWKLTVAKSLYHVGEDIPVHIVSDKVRSVGGTFTVSAECKNQSGVFVSYPISETHVNRAKGHVETEISTRVPDRIPNLPTTCRIGYVLEYQIYSFRDFSEYNFTNEFKLLPKEETTTQTLAPQPTPLVNTFPAVTSAPKSTTAKTVPASPAAQSSPSPSPQSQPSNCTIDLLGVHAFCPDGSIVKL